jgi:hypothetical protein
MKALFISTSLPPVAESQTIRNVFLIQGLQRAGFEVRGIAPAAKGGDPTLAGLLHKPLPIARTKQTVYSRLASPPWPPPGRARAFYLTALREGFARIAVPDAHFDWQRLAVQTGKIEIERDRPDVLITSCGSFTALFAGAKLARQYGIPWVADAGDPLALNPLPPLNYWYMRLINGVRERGALRSCSAMTLTTRETVLAYQKFLDKPPPLHYLPCGFSLPQDTLTNRSSAATFDIAYVGVASRGNRDLRNVMRALHECAKRMTQRRFRMLVVGTSHPAFAREAEALGSFEYAPTGWVSYEQSLVYMHRADLLLLRGNRGGMQIPAKAYNYIGSPVPILYVGEPDAAGDPTRALVQELPGVVCCTATFQSSYEALLDILTRHGSAKVDSARRQCSTDIRQFAWQSIGSRFASIVTEAVRRHTVMV